MRDAHYQERGYAIFDSDEKNRRRNLFDLVQDAQDKVESAGETIEEIQAFAEKVGVPKGDIEEASANAKIEAQEELKRQERQRQIDIENQKDSIKFEQRSLAEAKSDLQNMPGLIETNRAKIEDLKNSQNSVNFFDVSDKLREARSNQELYELNLRTAQTRIDKATETIAKEQKKLASLEAIVATEADKTNATFLALRGSLISLYADRKIVDPFFMQAIDNMREKVRVLRKQLKDKLKNYHQNCLGISNQQSRTSRHNQQFESATINAQNAYAYLAPNREDTEAFHAIESATNKIAPQHSYGFTLGGGGYHMNARFDLRNWRKARAAQDATYAARLQAAHAFGTTGGLIEDPRFNLFASASVSFGNNDAAGVGQDSTAYSVSGGISYRVKPNLNLGLAARFGEAQIDSNISDMDTVTWGISAFAQTQLEISERKLNLEAIVSWSRSDIDSVFNNAGVITTADAVTTAFSSQVKASTTINFDDVSISPSASFSYISTDQDAFALSDGQIAPGLGNDIWLYSLGTSIGLPPIKHDEYTYSPGLGFGMAGKLDDVDDINLSANASLGIRHKNGTSGSLSMGYSGFDGDTRNLTFSGAVAIPLN